MIYLDHAATSHPKAPGVPEAVRQVLAGGFGTPGRGAHGMALRAARLLFEVREACARTLGRAGAERLIFTRNATEALNLVIQGSVPDGGTVAVSSLEHHAVMRPLRMLEATRGVGVRVVPFDACGNPDTGVLRSVLGERPDLMVLTTASNVTGARTPVEAVAAACAAQGVPLCLDASQTVGHRPLPDVVATVCFSGHKGLLGPAGTGGLHLAPDLSPRPLILGGTGSRSDEELQPEALPDRYEAGTPNLPGLAGLGAALGFLEATGWERIQAREQALCEALARGLVALPGVRLHGPGPGEAREPVLSVSVEGWDPAELAEALDQRGICVRPGLHCAAAAHRTLGTLAAGGTLRLSPGFSTTDAEIQATLEALEDLLP